MERRTSTVGPARTFPFYAYFRMHKKSLVVFKKQLADERKPIRDDAPHPEPRTENTHSRIHSHALAVAF